MLSEHYRVQAVEPTLRDIREALTSVYGTDYGLRSANYISRFTDMARQAASYRERHVLLAGDAAHVHMSVSGSRLTPSIAQFKVHLARVRPVPLVSA